MPGERPEVQRAAGRLNAICADRERRRPVRHPEHDALTGEALQCIGELMRAGVMTPAVAADAMKRVQDE